MRGGRRFTALIAHPRECIYVYGFDGLLGAWYPPPDAAVCVASEIFGLCSLMTHSLPGFFFQKVKHIHAFFMLY